MVSSIHRRGTREFNVEAYLAVLIAPIKPALRDPLNVGIGAKDPDAYARKTTRGRDTWLGR